MGVREVVRAAVNWLTLADLQPAAVTFSETAPMPIDDMWREMLDPDAGPISRDQALTIPGVLRARNMIATVATLPLVEINARTRRPANSALLEQFDPNVPNIVHLSQTVEDLFFDAVSWWQVLARDARTDRPVLVRRCAPESVFVQPENGQRTPAPLPSGIDPRRSPGVYLDGRRLDDPGRTLIRFDSPLPPVRKVVARAMRNALDFDNAAAMYARNPRPLDYFTPNEFADDPADGAIRKFLRSWRRFRQQHATGYVPKWAKYETVDAPTPANLQLVQLQQWVTVQLAVALGVDAEDFGVSTTSRTYQNAVDRRQDRINDVLNFYLRAITDRLSMPDVTVRGHVVIADLDDYLRADPKTRWEVYEAQHRLFGDSILEEIRETERRPALPRPSRPTPVDATPAPGRDGRPPLRAVPSLPAGYDASHSAGVDAYAAFGVEFADDDARVTFDIGGRAHVDLEARTITGLAVPYNVVGSKGGRRFVIAPGALIIPTDLTRVKALEDHNRAAAFGHLQSYEDTPDGLIVTLKVGRGAHGDRMLQLAQDRVKDGLSVGITWEGLAGAVSPAPDHPGALRVHRAYLEEITQTAMPVFGGARVTAVAASHTEGAQMHTCATCGQQITPGVAHTCTTPATTAPAAPTAAAPAEPQQPATAAFSLDQLAAMLGNPQLAAAFAAYSGAAPAGGDGAAADQPPTVDPTATGAPALQASTGAGAGGLQAVREPSPYTFGWDRNTGEPVLTGDGDHEFSRDLTELWRTGDLDLTRPRTDAGKRVASFVREQFAVVTTDVNELNPTINRPDMYVDQRDYRTPLWNFVNKGGLPNGVQPFMFPKFNSASGLVGDHTEGVEPTGGAFTTTGQTVTPTALSGAVDIPREVMDMGGNPAVSTLIWRQMLRSHREGLESATATFLATLTAANDITLGVAATDAAFIAAWEAALVDLQFVRGYDFEAFAVEKLTYAKFAAAKYESGEPAYPMINPSNRNGTSRTRFRTLDVGGVEAVPAWALASVAGSLNSSWLFDPTVIHGWASAPQRLEFAGIDADGDYAPVAMIRIGLFGYKAFACSDIGGVRQVTYDTTS